MVDEYDFVKTGLSIVENGEVTTCLIEACDNFKEEKHNKPRLSLNERKAALEYLALTLRPMSKDLDDALLGMAKDKHNDLIDLLKDDISETNRSKELTYNIKRNFSK